MHLGDCSILQRERERHGDPLWLPLCNGLGVVCAVLTFAELGGPLPTQEPCAEGGPRAPPLSPALHQFSSLPPEKQLGWQTHPRGCLSPSGRGEGGRGQSSSPEHRWVGGSFALGSLNLQWRPQPGTLQKWWWAPTWRCVDVPFPPPMGVHVGVDATLQKGRGLPDSQGLWKRPPELGGWSPRVSRRARQPPVIWAGRVRTERGNASWEMLPAGHRESFLLGGGLQWRLLGLSVVFRLGATHCRCRSPLGNPLCFLTSGVQFFATTCSS